MLVAIIFILGIPSLGIAILSPLLALTLFISFKISKSKSKLKNYFGYGISVFWLVGLVGFWCYLGWYMSTLGSVSAANTGQIMFPFSGAFIFNAVVSYYFYRSFVKKYDAIPITNLNDAKLDQNIQSEDEVITKS